MAKDHEEAKEESEEEPLIRHPRSAPQAASLPHKTTTPSPPRSSPPIVPTEEEADTKLVDYPDSPAKEWANLPSPTLDMHLPASSGSLKEMVLTPEKPSMPIFPLEAQAGSNRQHEEEHEYAKLGAEWLSQSFSARWEPQSQLENPTPPQQLLSFHTQPAIPTTAQSEPSTPRCAPIEYNEDDWEEQMMKVVRRAKETQRGTSTKNKELAQ